MNASSPQVYKILLRLFLEVTTNIERWVSLGFGWCMSIRCRALNGEGCRHLPSGPGPPCKVTPVPCVPRVMSASHWGAELTASTCPLSLCFNYIFIGVLKVSFHIFKELYFSGSFRFKNVSLRPLNTHENLAGAGFFSLAFLPSQFVLQALNVAGESRANLGFCFCM